MSDELTPEDEAMLGRCLSRFQTRVAMHRMGIPLKKRPHPVTDEQYQRALANADVVDELMRKAFDRPRDPRSPEYKAGARACLERRLDRNAEVKCPYALGTAQADAWFAGVDEGWEIWHNAQSSVQP